MTREEYKAQMRYEGSHTPNGIRFEFELVSVDGAAFCLYPTPDNSTEEIEAAKQYLMNERDVVGVIKIK